MFIFADSFVWKFHVFILPLTNAHLSLGLFHAPFYNVVSFMGLLHFPSLQVWDTTISQMFSFSHVNMAYHWSSCKWQSKMHANFIFYDKYINCYLKVWLPVSDIVHCDDLISSLGSLRLLKLTTLVRILMVLNSVKAFFILINLNRFYIFLWIGILEFRYMKFSKY